MQADTAPLHTVFGAALGLLLSNSKVVEIATPTLIFIPIVAFSALAITAVASETCFRKTVLGYNPLPYLFFVSLIAVGMSIFLPGAAGRCAALDGNDPLAISLCADLDVENLLISMLMLIWCLSSIALALYRKTEEA